MIISMACRKLSFAVCFSRRIDDCSGFAGSSVGFNPFKYNRSKGLKPTEEEALPPDLLNRLLKQTAKDQAKSNRQTSIYKIN